MIAPTEDEFAAWQAHPVTAFVFAGLERMAVAALETAAADIMAMAPAQDDLTLRIRENVRVVRMERARVYREVVNVSFADALGANGIDPKEAKSG